MARHPDLDELFQRRNAIRDVAAACGISTAAVATWETVPRNRVETVAMVLRVDPSVLPVTGDRPKEQAA
jgi:hypothetical protein